LILDSSSSLPIISFDDVYCQDLASGHYHITRVQNPSNLNEEPRLGPRFNSENLKVQTKNILDRYGSEINIMDIGAFSGSTLIPEIERFRDAGINVKNVYLMFAGQNAIINIRNEGVNLKYAMTFNWIDWLELRDCIGFDGRKVLMDADSKDPQNSFIRYIENSKDWASIPEDVKHHYERLYVDSFDIIKSILACDGINADLSKSPDRELVYDLRIARR
jgi:hypothetical protein